MATIDITDAKELTLAVNNNLAPKRFLASFFQKLTHNTKDVMIDFVEGSQELAPFIRDGEAATVSARKGYNTRTIHCYDICLKRRTNAFDALKRLPGEAPIVDSAMSPTERAAELAGRDLFEMQGRANRTIEKMISDGIFNGSISITDAAGNTIDSINFGKKQSHSLSKTWSTSGYKKIVSDIEDAAILVAQDSGLTATDVILGSTAAKTALENDFFLKQLDTKDLTIGSLKSTMELQNRGARLIGTLSGMRVWRYDEIYKSGNNAIGIVPASGVVVLSADLQATLHYGVAGDIKNGFTEGEFAADTYYENDPAAQWLRLRTAPLPVIEQIDGLATITVS